MSRQTQAGQDTVKANPELIKVMIRASVEAGRDSVPLFLSGPPGVGKSSLAREVAEELEIGFVDLRLVQLDPVDIRGLPYTLPIAGGAETLSGFAPPKFLPRDGRGILFLDELPQAQPLVMNAVSELVLDRRCGDYILPDGWVIIAAGNRRSDRAAVHEIPSHLKNRFTHIELEPSFDDWKAWASEPRESDGRSRIHPGILNYLNTNQANLNRFNADLTSCPTSRSWEFASRIMDYTSDKKACRALIQGAIGKHIASELFAHLEMDDDMPTVASIMANPMTAPKPESTSVINSVLSNLAKTFKSDGAGQFAEYLGRFEPEHCFAAVAEIMTRKDYDQWKSNKKFAELLTSTGLG